MLEVGAFKKEIMKPDIGSFLKDFTAINQFCDEFLLSAFKHGVITLERR